MLVVFPHCFPRPHPHLLLRPPLRLPPTEEPEHDEGGTAPLFRTKFPALLFFRITLFSNACTLQPLQCAVSLKPLFLALSFTASWLCSLFFTFTTQSQLVILVSCHTLLWNTCISPCQVLSCSLAHCSCCSRHVWLMTELHLVVELRPPPPARHRQLACTPGRHTGSTRLLRSGKPAQASDQYDVCRLGIHFIWNTPICAITSLEGLPIV